MTNRAKELEKFIKRLNTYLVKIPTKSIPDKIFYLRSIIDSIVNSKECETLFGEYFPFISPYHLKKTKVYLDVAIKHGNFYVSKLSFIDYSKDEEYRTSYINSINLLNRDLDSMDYESLIPADPFDFSALKMIKF